MREAADGAGTREGRPAPAAGTPANWRSLRQGIVLGALAGAALLAAMVDVMLGQSGVDPWRALGLLFTPDGSADAHLIQSVRLPRAVAAVAWAPRSEWRAR